MNDILNIDNGIIVYKNYDKYTNDFDLCFYRKEGMFHLLDYSRSGVIRSMTTFLKFEELESIYNFLKNREVKK